MARPVILPLVVLLSTALAAVGARGDATPPPLGIQSYVCLDQRTTEFVGAPAILSDALAFASFKNPHPSTTAEDAGVRPLPLTRGNLEHSQLASQPRLGAPSSANSVLFKADGSLLDCPQEGDCLFSEAVSGLPITTGSDTSVISYVKNGAGTLALLDGSGKVLFSYQPQQTFGSVTSFDSPVDFAYLPPQLQNTTDGGIAQWHSEQGTILFGSVSNSSATQGSVHLSALDLTSLATSGTAPKLQSLVSYTARVEKNTDGVDTITNRLRNVLAVGDFALAFSGDSSLVLVSMSSDPRNGTASFMELQTPCGLTAAPGQQLQMVLVPLNDTSLHNGTYIRERSYAHLGSAHVLLIFGNTTGSSFSVCRFDPTRAAAVKSTGSSKGKVWVHTQPFALNVASVVGVRDAVEITGRVGPSNSTKNLKGSYVTFGVGTAAGENLPARQRHEAHDVALPPVMIPGAYVNGSSFVIQQQGTLRAFDTHISMGHNALWVSNATCKSPMSVWWDARMLFCVDLDGFLIAVNTVNGEFVELDAIVRRTLYSARVAPVVTLPPLTAEPLLWAAQIVPAVPGTSVGTCLTAMQLVAPVTPAPYPTEPPGRQGVLSLVLIVILAVFVVVLVVAFVRIAYLTKLVRRESLRGESSRSVDSLVGRGVNGDGSDARYGGV